MGCARPGAPGHARPTDSLPTAPSPALPLALPLQAPPAASLRAPASSRCPPPPTPTPPTAPPAPPPPSLWTACWVSEGEGSGGQGRSLGQGARCPPQLAPSSSAPLLTPAVRVLPSPVHPTPRRRLRRRRRLHLHHRRRRVQRVGERRAQPGGRVRLHPLPGLHPRRLWHPGLRHHARQDGWVWGACVWLCAWRLLHAARSLSPTPSPSPPSPAPPRRHHPHHRHQRRRGDGGGRLRPRVCARGGQRAPQRLRHRQPPAGQPLIACWLLPASTAQYPLCLCWAIPVAAPSSSALHYSAPPFLPCTAESLPIFPTSPRLCLPFVLDSLPPLGLMQGCSR